MANLRKWSSSASGNATVAGGSNTINFAEGQSPGSVNNSAREVMAQIRSVYKPEEWGWVEHSNTASVASQTTFKLTGDQTTNWTAGRRWRLKSGSSTRYGAVVSSSYTTETTITVTVDSGSLSASHSLAALAAIDSNHIPTNSYITSSSLTTALGSYVTSSSLATALGAYLTSASASAAYLTSASAASAYITSASVSAMISTAAGGMTLLGTIDVSSGTNANLGSLTLTNYKQIQLFFINVGIGNATNLLLGTSTADDVQCTANGDGSAYRGTIFIDLSDGSFVTTMFKTGTSTSVGWAGDSTITTASTAISVAINDNNFSSGSVRVYGLK